MAVKKFTPGARPPHASTPAATRLLFSGLADLGRSRLAELEDVIAGAFALLREHEATLQAGAVPQEAA